MPRKTKDAENLIESVEETTKKNKVNSKKDVKKTSSSKKSSLKTKTAKKADTKAVETKAIKKVATKPTKETTKVAKKATKKVDTKTEKVKATKKASTKTTKKLDAKTEEAKATKKVSTKTAKKSDTKPEKEKATKKSTSKASKTTKKTNTKTTSTKVAKNTTKKTTTKSTKKNTTKAKEVSKEVLEYYDLPYRYNETIVKILAQTPKKLFIYWDISDEDRNNYINKFGSEFFNNTVPVLIIHNNSMNYTFEVEINDFANCWYLDINDTKCDYSIELGRRSKKQDYYIPNNYLYVASSNKIETPNDHILFEKLSRTVYFRNVKNNSVYEKDISNLSFMQNMGKIYSIYDAYRKMYNQMYGEIDIINEFDLNNPSSGNPTSTFK